MAFQRSHGTLSLMNTRNADNQKIGGMDKKLPGKSLAAAVPARQTRAALGNLSNRQSSISVKSNAQKEHNELVKKPVNQKIRTSKQQQQTVETVQGVKKEVPQTAIITKSVVVTKHEDVQESTVTSSVAMVTSAQEECETAVPMDMSCTSHDGEEDTDEAFSKQMLKLNVHDIDQDDASNPQLVSEYVNDIYEYMRELELKFNIRPKCMANQTEINGRMRGILIDWLIQVHLRFQLLQETLYLTISILDRYLQVENVAKSKLQLVGVTCMWVACKYEEMYAPEVADFVYITDNAYSSTEMRQMECQILIALDFQLGRPLAIHFLRRNSKAGEVDATMHTMAKYLMELTVVDYDMVHLRPSEIAAAALCLAIKLISNAPWTPTLVYYSRYTEQQLMPIIRKMADLVLSAGTGKLTSIKGKYQSSKFMRISKSPVLESGLLEELCSDDTLLTAAL